MGKKIDHRRISEPAQLPVTDLFAKRLGYLAEYIRRPRGYALYHGTWRVIRGILANEPNDTRPCLGVPNLIDTICKACDDRQWRR